MPTRLRESSSDWRALAPQDDFGVLTRAGCESLWRVAAVDNRLRPISTGVKGQSARASGRKPEVIQLDEKSPYRRCDCSADRLGRLRIPGYPPGFQGRRHLASENPIVFAARANPEPDDIRPVKLTESSITKTHPGGVNVVLLIDSPRCERFHPISSSNERVSPRPSFLIVQSFDNLAGNSVLLFAGERFHAP
jgi:hypothetical protein